MIFDMIIFNILIPRPERKWQIFISTIEKTRKCSHNATGEYSCIILHWFPDISMSREVVEKSPSPQSYLLLGDAYMSITEPERALEIYEQVANRKSDLL